jgi:hypothetical protein
MKAAEQSGRLTISYTQLTLTGLYVSQTITMRLYRPPLCSTVRHSTVDEAIIMQCRMVVEEVDLLVSEG